MVVLNVVVLVDWARAVDVALESASASESLVSAAAAVEVVEVLKRPAA